MNDAKIIECVDEVVKFVGIMGFTILIVVPVIFSIYSNDERFNSKAAKIIDTFNKDTLRPLTVAVVIAWALVRIMLKG